MGKNHERTSVAITDWRSSYTRFGREFSLVLSIGFTGAPLSSFHQKEVWKALRFTASIQWRCILATTSLSFGRAAFITRKQGTMTSRNVTPRHTPGAGDGRLCLPKQRSWLDYHPLMVASFLTETY